MYPRMNIRPRIHPMYPMYPMYKKKNKQVKHKRAMYPRINIYPRIHFFLLFRVFLTLPAAWANSHWSS